MVTQLSALLRVAVALDRRGVGAVANISATYDSENHALYMDVKSASPDDDCASELWNLDYKKDYFEDVFETTLKARLVS